MLSLHRAVHPSLSVPSSWRYEPNVIFFAVLAWFSSNRSESCGRGHAVQDADALAIIIDMSGAHVMASAAAEGDLPLDRVADVATRALGVQPLQPHVAPPAFMKPTAPFAPKAKANLIIALDSLGEGTFCIALVAGHYCRLFICWLFGVGINPRCPGQSQHGVAAAAAQHAPVVQADGPGVPGLDCG